MGKTKDIAMLWSNARDLERRVLMNITEVNSKAVNNGVDIQLLAKDVTTALDNMNEFMGMFKAHDIKEMEKYDTIDKTLRSMDKKLEAYTVITDAQGTDMEYLKGIADKGKVFMVRATWTVTVVAVLMGTIQIVHPFIEEYFISKAAREGRMNTEQYTNTTIRTGVINDKEFQEK